MFIGVVVAPSVNSSAVETNLARRTSVLNSSIVALPLINFRSWVIIEYDKEYANQTFIRDYTYAIPANISYKVDVPSWLLNSHFLFFKLLKNWFLFGSFITPNMIVNISTENVPTWAEVYPSTPNILLPPFNEWTIINFTVIVIIHDQAPSGPFVFSLSAEALALHRINGYYINVSIPIIVQ